MRLCKCGADVWVAGMCRPCFERKLEARVAAERHDELAQRDHNALRRFQNLWTVGAVLRARRR
jgi:hypothetical protein